MSKLSELIQEYCPNGVEYVKLGDLSSIVTKQTGFDYSNHIKKNLLSEQKEDSIPYIQTKFFSGKNFNYCTDYYVPKEVADKFPKITLDTKCLLFSIVGSIGNVGLFDGTQKCFLGGAICVAKVLEKYNIDFLYYCAESEYIQSCIRKKIKGSGQTTITVDDIRNLEFPFPPLPVQDEIVRILDKYTVQEAELEAELDAELVMRKQQYEYYRDMMCSFDETVPQIPLGELFTFKNGINKGKDCFGHGTPIVNFTDVYNKNRLFSKDVLGLVEITDSENERFNVSKGDVFFTRTSETVNEVGYSSVIVENIENCIFSGFLIKGHPITELLLPEYCSYCFRTSGFRKEIVSKAHMTTRATITGETLKNITIAVPSIETQKHIVDILDKLSAWTEDISKGLSVEIKMRHQQYEYYRDKLLTFERI